MLRKTAAMLFIMSLAFTSNLEAQSRYKINVFSGLRFGGSFVNARYLNNTFLQDLDVAPGVQFGGSFYFPISTRFPREHTPLFELLVNFQSSDLRFKPASLSGIPDSILAQLETDGDRLILGEVSMTYIHAGISYELDGNSGWTPHVNLGLGVTIMTADDGDFNKSKFSFSFGGGMTRMFTESIGSQFQLRGYMTPLPRDVYWVGSGGGSFRSVENSFFFQGEVSGGLVFAF